MRSDTWLRGTLLAACMTLATAAPALAQKSADTLRITWRDAIPASWTRPHILRRKTIN